MHRARPESHGYQLFILLLSVGALIALAIDTTVPVDPESQKILEYADLVVCGLFFIDFLRCLRRADDRWRYMYTWGWLDLLASIPALDAARWGRLARAGRILRVLRGLRAGRLVLALILRTRRESAFLAATLLVLLLLVVSSVSILHFESSDGNIHTAEEALWWTITTITTVGYGDRYPVTSEGRLVAALLMCAGVGLFGMFSGFLASWFVAPEADQRAGEMEMLREEMRMMREAIERLNRPPREGVHG